MTRILVIDDDPLIRESLGNGLKLSGYDVEVAEDGAKGLKRLQAHSADVVLVDILMPEKEGLETIREMRKLYPDLRIVAMSGGGATRNLNFLEMARTFGADITLQKPFRVKELLAHIARLCGPPGKGD